MPEQIALIERLIEGGKAYQAPDKSVYFKVMLLRIMDPYPSWQIVRLRLPVPIGKVPMSMIVIQRQISLLEKHDDQKTAKITGSLLGAG